MPFYKGSLPEMVADKDGGVDRKDALTEQQDGHRIGRRAYVKLAGLAVATVALGEGYSIVAASSSTAAETFTTDFSEYSA